MPKVLFKNEEVELEVPEGTNLRTLARQHKIELYPYLARFANCRGFGMCGTCRVRVAPADAVTQKTAKEEGAIPGRDDSWRLACQTFVRGDCRVLTLPAEPEPWFRHPTYAKLQVKEEV
ncbi:MAG: 2Fe-2S iron-sulfur cluster-binding protein [Acidobacteriota bacterium]